ncbi:MAG: zinc-dependent metalloprotease [Saprospiraceae bacterium]|nr:zinc-dependent metalloprotease [Saprospiraceae bacterium]
MRLIYIIILLIPIFAIAQDDNENTPFFNHSYINDSGKVQLEVSNLNREFLYVNSLAAGVGSNDIGLDRGKLNRTRIVKFIKRGNKLLLLQPNQKFRANSSNLQEVKAVEQAFASSILWGFDIIKTQNDVYTIDITSFLLHDSNGIIKTLKDQKQGSYKLDKTRSVVDNQQIFSFPKNIEFEAILTFVGDGNGKYIRSVAPSNNAVTVSQHQSFIALPDSGYQPRVFHPYSGFNNISYYDYATPIEQAMNKRFITRHRLQKKNKGSALSEAIEPIVYYVDSGCPEPVKSALIEGASWWNQAFTAAGFKDAFLVKELPKDAHPLDVRYNVIQWVHRSTRGWSYGASVVDPRTGEIIKGHVSLGSLRVRQDFMIAQGILAPYSTENDDHTPMKEMALARLRQLSAHEVGHTIGLAHNFAASVNNRASVMDYPHPLVTLNQNKIDLSNAYDDKIGEWDKRTIMYGYTEFADGKESAIGLNEILRGTKGLNLLYMSDQDARPMGSAHPMAHLWDNGSDPIDELKRLAILRKYSLENFGADNIPQGTPYSEIEKVIVPVYLMHRYQIEAVSKIIGGVDYTYAVKGFDEPINKPVSEPVQHHAMQVLLSMLSPEALAIPSNAMDVLLPAAKGYGRNRESLKSNAEMVFDPLNSAEALSNFVLTLMLHPDRLTRINQQDASLSEYLNAMQSNLFSVGESDDNYMNQLAMIPQKAYVIHLIKLAKGNKFDKQIVAMAQLKLKEITSLFKNDTSDDWKAHNLYLWKMIQNLDKQPELVELPGMAEMPPGSPIGCDR